MTKILVVDDIATNRKLLRQMIVTLEGFDVVEAVNGKDAVEVFENHAPDLILLDINMPEMDGFQAAGRIKELTGDDYVPIIFITAMSEASLAKALASGGDDFISKPFDIEVLKSKINAHLRIRELCLQINARNIELVREHNLMEHYFEKALQKSYLDENIINYHMSPMSAFNGDVMLSGRTSDGRVYALVGDFTGHGLTAAMGTLPVSMIFFKMVNECCSSNEILSEINEQLISLLPTSMFLAAALLEYVAETNRISIWIGGLPEIYWLSSGGELKDVIKSSSMALGISKNDCLDDQIKVYDVEKGDKFYMYSDGITEAQSSDGEMFGSERLKKILLNSSDNRINNVISELIKFSGEDDQGDDITLVEMTCGEIVSP